MAKQKTQEFYIANSFYEKEKVEGIIKTFDECPNEQFGFRKVKDNLWNVTHVRSGLEAVQGKSQAVCTKELKKLLSNKRTVEYIQHVPDIDTAIAQRKAQDTEKYEKIKKFNKLSDEFYKLTNIRVPRDMIIGGVDIIKLDKMLKTPDGISLNEHLKNLYGDRASRIVDEMVNNI